MLRHAMLLILLVFFAIDFTKMIYAIAMMPLFYAYCLPLPPRRLLRHNAIATLRHTRRHYWHCCLPSRRCYMFAPPACRCCAMSFFIFHADTRDIIIAMLTMMI